MTPTTNPGGRPASNGIGASRSPTVENLVEPRRRGRPRSSGGRHCDRCERAVAKIRVRWPDGAICGACFSSAVHEYGPCSTCGDQRMLPGRSPAGEHICRDCAGITTSLACDRCGSEAERFRKGVCARCVVREDLESLLKPNSPPDLRLKRLVGILADAGRPESIYTWMNKPAPKRLLTLIGQREVALTHEAFDGYAPPPARLPTCARSSCTTGCCRNGAVSRSRSSRAGWNSGLSNSRNGQRFTVRSSDLRGGIT